MTEGAPAGVPPERLRTDGVLLREPDPDVVADYVQALERGDPFPPGEVVWDGKEYWLWDGGHRCAAHRQLGRDFAVNVRDGTQEEAQWLASGANTTHGLRRSNDHKRKAVELALRLHPEQSNSALAGHCGVDEKMVRTARTRLEAAGDVRAAKVRTGKDNRELDTGGIGRRAPKEARPGSPLPRPATSAKPKSSPPRADPESRAEDAPPAPPAAAAGAPTGARPESLLGGPTGAKPADRDVHAELRGHLAQVTVAFETAHHAALDACMGDVLVCLSQGLERATEALACDPGPFLEGHAGAAAGLAGWCDQWWQVFAAIAGPTPQGRAAGGEQGRPCAARDLARWTDACATLPNDVLADSLGAFYGWLTRGLLRLAAARRNPTDRFREARAAHQAAAEELRKAAFLWLDDPERALPDSGGGGLRAEGQEPDSRGGPQPAAPQAARLTKADIAALANVTVRSVTTWAQQDDFPEPVDREGPRGSPRWEEPQVLLWLGRRAAARGETVTLN
jgi:hypothetical protein